MNLYKFSTICLLAIMIGCESAKKDTRTAKEKKTTETINNSFTSSTNPKLLVDQLADSSYQFAVGDFSLKIAPKRGGEITSIQWGNEEFLAFANPEATLPISFAVVISEGNSFSYQSLYQQDYEEYWQWETLEMKGTPNNDIGLKLDKKIQVSAEDTSFILTYVVTNISDKPIKLFPQEGISAPKNSLAFFPLKKFTLKNIRESNIQTGFVDGIFWCQVTKDYKGKDVNLGGDGQMGWIGYTHNSMVLIKKTTEIVDYHLPDGLGSTKLSIHGADDKVEIVQRGEYKTLAPNESMHYESKWYLRPTPFEAKFGDRRLTSMAMQWSSKPL